MQRRRSSPRLMCCGSDARLESEAASAPGSGGTNNNIAANTRAADAFIQILGTFAPRCWGHLERSLARCAAHKRARPRDLLPPCLRSTCPRSPYPSGKGAGAARALPSRGSLLFDMHSSDPPLFSFCTVANGAAWCAMYDEHVGVGMCCDLDTRADAEHLCPPRVSAFHDDDQVSPELVR